MVGPEVGVIAMRTSVPSLSGSSGWKRPRRYGPTSPVWDNSCSASLEGFVYALSHPSHRHLYFLSAAGVADLDRDVVVRFRGVGGVALSGSGSSLSTLDIDPAAFEGPAPAVSMKSNDVPISGLCLTASIAAGSKSYVLRG